MVQRDTRQFITVILILLSLVTPLFSDSLHATSFVNASHWQTPLSNELESYFSVHSLFTFAFYMFGLVHQDGAFLNFVSLLFVIRQVVTTGLSFLALGPFIIVGSPLYQSMFIPLALAVFGVYSLWRQHASWSIFGEASDAESDGYLNVPFFLFNGLTIVRASAALFSFDNFVESLPQSAQEGFAAQPLARALAHLSASYLVIRSVFFLLLWRRADRSQRTLLGGLAALFLFLAFENSFLAPVVSGSQVGKKRGFTF